jgi:two-component system OmpR family sensor kinase
MTRLSLRGRLLLATVILVTLGLFAADAATFALLRSSLIDRVDEQLEGARLFATRALFDPGDRTPPPGIAGPFRGRGGPSAQYVELLDGSGVLVASRSFGFGSIGAPPKLPDGLPGSAAQRDSQTSRIFTTGSEGGSSLRYRVLATGLGSAQGTIVVAFPLGDVDATLRRLLLVEGIVTASVLAAVAALALWLVRLGMRPLTQMEQAAAGIAAGDLSRRVEPADGRTEVGRLGLALNSMLERIEAAFTERRATEARLRRFVADASHELRTPLTSIRGYAELFRRGADVRPEDLAKSMRRIEEESSRMGTLVEELLLLARLDQGPRLDRRPVDLATVARDAVEDARAVEPGRPIDVEDPGPIVIDGDDARLRQVAANLLSNALEHTPPGTPVHVRVTTDGDQAMLEVADEGPGLEHDQAAKVFDRFFRVDPARSRDNGGLGLGLSIVAAIVQAHGGWVSVETSPGGGATFIVALPIGAPAEESAHEPSSV